MMNDNFIQFVRNSCCDALSADAEYMKLQSNHAIAISDKDNDSAEEIQDEMECRAEEVCFAAGWNAAMQLILKGVSV